MTDLRQREQPIKDPAHLAFVRTQPCCCGCRRAAPTEAAHVRMTRPGVAKRPTGMAEKPSDRWTVPLSAWCHREGPDAQHRSSEAVFWESRGVDPFAIADRLWLASGAATRHADGPAPRSRKPRPRPIAAKVKRKWSSRPFPAGRGFPK